AHRRAAPMAQRSVSMGGELDAHAVSRDWRRNPIPGRESVLHRNRRYRFIEHVIGDVVAMHREAGVPLRHIHMGGDEVPNGVWAGSPAVQAYLKAHDLTSVDDLWFVFYGRVEQILKAQGLVPSGWEEIAVRKTSRDGRRTNIPNPDFAARGWRAYVWNNVPGGGAEDLAYRLANGGYDVVLSPVSNLYFDLAWNENPEETGLDWGGYVGLRKPFQFL